MTMTREEYSRLSYKTDDSNPLFAVGNIITIPDVPAEGMYKGNSTYGRCPTHKVGEEMKITDLRYSPKQEQFRYLVNDRWWYLEMDLIGHGGDKQIPMFKKESYE